mgnify:CR=1 FL=1
MRLLFSLREIADNRLSINYNHALMSSIYKLLKFGSPEFSEFLHNTGFKVNGQSFKLFTYSLKLEDAHLFNNSLSLQSPYAKLYISSPLTESFLKNILIGSFENQVIEIFSENIKTVFAIKNVELLPEENFSGKNYFKLASPLVLSKRILFNGADSKYYFRVEDNIDEINKFLNNNLIRKYEAINNDVYNNGGVKLTWDKDYILSARKAHKRLSKKISIFKDINNPVEVIGMYCPFYLEGDEQLIKVGYDCGFGENNSLGFGLAFKEKR